MSPLPDFLPQFGDIDECLCSVAQIIDDLNPLLLELQEETTPATLHLGDFVCANAGYLQKGKLANAFWAERPDQENQVINWFATLDFAVVLDLAELGTLPREVAAELVQAVKRRTKTK